jgi:2-polyprenyl-3-methyl-5-hydroxy-6-metoxy-1,4-benzoquinol methylase
LVQLAESSPAACSVCSSTGARRLYSARDRLGSSDREFWIAECSGCGVLRTLPVMSETELAAFYPNDYWGAEEKPSQEWIVSSQSDKTRFLASCKLDSGRILDVGCGSGFFLRALDPARWERFGVELGKGAVDASRQALGRDRVFEGTLSDAAYADSEFDVVTLWSALEHTNQPKSTLAEARRVLKPGGSLIVQVPNAASYQLRLFSGRWFALDVPRHRYHFTPATLERLLSELGLSIYRSTFFSKAHNAHALRQSLKAELWPARATRALFYLSIPFIKPVDLIMSGLGKGATMTVASRK